MMMSVTRGRAPDVIMTIGRAPDVTPGRPPPVAPGQVGRVPGRGPSPPLTPELVSPPKLGLLVALHHDEGFTFPVLNTTDVQSIPVARNRKPKHTENIDLLEM